MSGRCRKSDRNLIHKCGKRGVALDYLCWCHRWQSKGTTGLQGGWGACIKDVQAFPPLHLGGHSLCSKLDMTLNSALSLSQSLRLPTLWMSHVPPLAPC